MRKAIGKTVAFASAVPAAAQLTPAANALGLLRRAVHENHAERGRERQRGKVPTKTAAEPAKEREWMNRSERLGLYDDCPR